MKVVLTTRVVNLGQPWEVKEVKNGYAMNFLFPQKLAVPATPHALQRAEKLQAERVKHVEEMKANATEMAKKMKGMTLSFKQKAKGDKLYGSIVEKDIVEAMATQHKMEVNKEMVKMGQHIKTVGEHKITLHLAEKVEVEIMVMVEAE